MCSHHAAALISQPSISAHLHSKRHSCRSSIVVRAANVKAGQPSTPQNKEQDEQAHVIQRIQQLEAEVQKAYQSGYNTGYTAGVKVTVNVDLSRTSSSRSSRTQPTSNSTSLQTSSSSSTSNSNGSSGSDADLENSSSNGAGSSKVSSRPDQQQQQQREESTSSGLIETPAASTPAVDVGDSILRSAVKGLVWRLFSTTVTVSIALLLLHDVLQVEDALKLGALEFTAKFLMYFLHERMWAMLPILQTRAG